MTNILVTVISFVIWVIMTSIIHLIISIFTSPFLRTQIILQCNEKSDEPLNIVLIFKRIIKYEGYRGLWRSYLPIVFSFVVSEPIRATLISLIPNIVEDAVYADSESYIVWILMNTCRESVSSAILLIFTYPFNFAEIKLANDARLNEYSKIQYKGIKDLFKKTLLTDGISGLYNGIGIDLLGMVGYGLISWSLLGFIHSFGLSIDSAASGCVADFFAASLTYPLVVLRSKTIVKPKNHGVINIWKSFTDIIKNEGITGLFGGYFFVLIDVFAFSLVHTLFDQFIVLK